MMVNNVIPEFPGGLKWEGVGRGGGGGENGKFLMWRVYFLDKQKAEGWTGSKRKRKQT